MYQEISIKQELPPIGEFVTTIDEDGHHRVYKMNGDKSWTMRDADGINSPNNNLKITHWLKEGISRDDFISLTYIYKQIKLTEEKKVELFRMKDNVIEILKGHTEIPEDEIFKLFRQIDSLITHLDDYIKSKYNEAGVK